MIRLLLLFSVACGSSAKPAAQPVEPAPSTTSTPATPATPEHGCPARAEVVSAIGTPCPTEGQFCGNKEAAAATGFSNVLSCTDGHWKNHEVPPPAPR
ncbi:MAG: hypothetical protein ABI678_07750 [Kofleriaceae bacterium]